MAKRDRERVGFVLAKGTGRRKEPGHHEADLVLRRRALADDGELHLGRRVLVHVGATLARGQQYDPANVPDLEGRVRALSNERGLDRDLVRMRLDQDLHQPFIDREELVGEGERCPRRDDARALVVKTASVEAKKTVTGDTTAGIDSEDQRAGPSRRRVRRYIGPGRG